MDLRPSAYLHVAPTTFFDLRYLYIIAYSTSIVRLILHLSDSRCRFFPRVRLVV